MEMREKEGEPENRKESRMIHRNVTHWEKQREE